MSSLTLSNMACSFASAPSSSIKSTTLKWDSVNCVSRMSNLVANAACVSIVCGK